MARALVLEWARALESIGIDDEQGFGTVRSHRGIAAAGIAAEPRTNRKDIRG